MAALPAALRHCGRLFDSLNELDSLTYGSLLFDSLDSTGCEEVLRLKFRTFPVSVAHHLLGCGAYYVV